MNPVVFIRRIYCSSSHGELDKRIDADLIKQTEASRSYWKKVVYLVVESIRFLVQRGLPIRGTDEIIGFACNGNFLGIIEFISKSDPFLKELINLMPAKERVAHISYLSKTTIEELIQLLSDVVFKYIIRELKHYKMFLNNC